MSVKIPTETGDMPKYVKRALQMVRASGSATINIRGTLLRSRVWSIAKSKDISQQRLATFLGTREEIVWLSFIRDEGSFMKEVPPDTAEDLAKFLGVPVEEIYRINISVI